MSVSVPSQPRPPRPERAALIVVYFTVFLDLMGFGIILPFLPYYAIDLGASGLGLGVLLTSYSLAQLCGSAVLGRLSDRHGRRPILILSLSGAALGMVLSGLAETLVALSLARALAGLFGGSIATAQAYIADVTGAQERAKYMGMLGASIGLGFVFGPALGVGLDTLGLGFSGAAFAAAALMLVNLSAAVIKLREPAIEERTQRRRRTWLDWLDAFRQPDLWRTLVATFFTTFAFVNMETTFALLGDERFGLDERGFGKILVLIGGIIVVVQGGLIGRLTQRFGLRWIAFIGCVTMGTTLATLPFMPSLGWTILMLAALAAGQGLSTPSLTTLTSRISAADEQGAVLGAGQSLAAAARAFGPIVAGSLYDLHLSLPYLIGGLLAVLAGGLVVGVRNID